MSAFPQYKSKLASWHDQATVRVKPRRLLETIQTELDYFAPEAVPACSHRLVTRRGTSAVKTLLLYSLYRYLDYTTVLEHAVVNSVAQKITRTTPGAEFPADTVMDAHRIYCDEAYHALFSFDLKQQAQVCTGTPAPPPRVPHFYMCLQKMLDSSPTDMRDLIELHFAVVTETLISTSLVAIARSQRVVQAVRSLIVDHLEDEARHHVAFSSVFEYLWPRLSQSKRDTLGPLFPRMILGFLTPDYSALLDDLCRLGLSANEAGLVVEESYPVDDALANARQAARATLALLTRNGVLSDTCVRDCFFDSGLLVQDG